MANAFIRLDRIGNGYCIPTPATSRGDEPMCCERFIIGGVGPGPGFHPTNFPINEFCACICGWDTDNVNTNFERLKMEKDLSGFWFITWRVNDPTGANMCVDVCFTKRSICKDQLEPIDVVGEE